MTVKKLKRIEFKGLPKPIERFNNWGERKWSAPPDELSKKVNLELKSLKFSPRALAFFKYAKLTKSSGVEFVLFSNTHLPCPAIFTKDKIHVVPCFYPQNTLSDGTEDIRLMAMEKAGKFIYDVIISLFTSP